MWQDEDGTWWLEVDLNDLDEEAWERIKQSGLFMNINHQGGYLLLAELIQ